MATTTTDKEYKFFIVRALPLAGNRKTHEYIIINKRNGTPLGTIAWYVPWRQFCFFPSDDSVWSSDCLADIESAIQWIKAQRR